MRSPTLPALLPRPGTLLPPVLLALLLLPGALAAQESPAARHGQLSGVVVDDRTGEPVRGALVALPGLRRAAVTGERGEFTLPNLAPGEHPLVVTQLGYDTLRASAPVTAGQASELEIGLDPNPVLLEGIRVVADRLQRRRNAVAVSIRAFDRSQLLTSAAGDALDFVSQRSGFARTVCPGSLAGSCAWVRGRPEPVRVYIDDMPTVGGLDHLAMYRPHELFLIEVVSGGRQVRAYTNWYMEQAAKRRWNPAPYF
jgi:hypothetical protein